MGNKAKSSKRQQRQPTFQQAAADADLAWCLILQHTLHHASHADQQLICCKLLCCSKALAQRVHSTAAGQLHVSIPGRPLLWHNRPETLHADYYRLISRWLARNAKLLSSLVFLRGVAPTAADEQVLAAALIAAAGIGAGSSRHITCGPVTRSAAAAANVITAAAVAGGQHDSHHQQQQGLLLRKLSVEWLRWAMQGSLLCAVAATCSDLQHLSINVCATALLADTARALGRLTNLCSLSWSGNDVSAIAPKLKQLGCLTQLALSSGFIDLKYFRQHWPSSLVHLKLDDNPWSQRLRSSISHLTTLQRLEYDGDLAADCQFPTSLQQLHAGKYHSHEALLPLKALRALTFICRLSPADAQHFSKVTQLQEVEMCEFDIVLGSSWRERPRRWGTILRQWHMPSSIRTLVLRGTVGFDESACQQLEALTQLQHLGLRSVHCYAPPARLGQAVKALTRLTGLELRIRGFEVANLENQAGALDTRGLCTCISQLPGLQRLEAVDLPLSLAAVAALAAATQLTALHLERCDLSPDSVGVLRTSLMQLQCLQAGVGPSKPVVYSGDVAVFDPAAF